MIRICLFVSEFLSLPPSPSSVELALAPFYYFLYFVRSILYELQ